MLEKFLADFKGNLDINIFIHDHEESLKIPSKNIQYTKHFLSLWDSLEKTRNAKCVLDLCKNHHIGLSFVFLIAYQQKQKLSPIIKM